MKRAEAERLIRDHVVRHFPGFGVEGDILIRDDDHLILRAVAFERSQLDRHTFNLTAFAQTLSIPNEGIDLGISTQLGRYEVGHDDEATFSAVRKDIHDNALPFLSQFDDYRSAASCVMRVSEYTMGPEYAMEERRLCPSPRRRIRRGGRRCWKRSRWRRNGASASRSRRSPRRC